MITLCIVAIIGVYYSMWETMYQGRYNVGMFTFYGCCLYIIGLIYLAKRLERNGNHKA